MRTKFFSAILFLCISCAIYAQDKPFNKFEIKTGVGLHINTFYANILGPKLETFGNRYEGIAVGDPRAGRKFYYGRSTWVELGYQWSKRYQAYASFYMNDKKVPYDDPLGLWWEIDEKQVARSYVLGVNRIFNADGAFNYTLGLGLTYNEYNIERAKYEVFKYEGNNIAVGQMANKYYGEEIGLSLNFSGSYNISKSANVGLRFTSIYHLHIGVEHLVLSPFIGVKF